MTTESGLIDIVIDLIKSADEALPDGGKVKISATQVGENVRLAINDNGVGIDSHTLERASTSFCSTKNDVGSRLGLSTIEGLVNAWGGHLDLASTSGENPTAIVILPINKRHT
jgi:signal transduction histidine kinase